MFNFFIPSLLLCLSLCAHLFILCLARRKNSLGNVRRKLLQFLETHWVSFSKKDWQHFNSNTIVAYMSCDLTLFSCYSISHKVFVFVGIVSTSSQQFILFVCTTFSHLRVGFYNCLQACIRSLKCNLNG